MPVTVLLLCILPLQAYYGHCEALRLLSETLVSLDVRDIEGRTALHLAAQRGFAPCVEVLLKHQASSTLKEHKNKWTALHAAGVCWIPGCLRNPYKIGLVQIYSWF